MTNKERIDEIKRQGLRVYVAHRRPLDVYGGPSKELYTRKERDENLGVFARTGGTTTVEVIDREGLAIASGHSRCSRYDSFDRKMGLTIALGRAAKELRSMGYSA